VALAVVLGGFSVAWAGEGAAAIAAQDDPPDPEEVDDLHELGAYEREALARALEARGLRVVAEPDGSVIRRIHVVNLEPFDDELAILTLLNNLRRTTRERTIAREVLLQPGDRWDAEKVAETRRNLEDPAYSSLVVIRPVRPTGDEDGEEVDLLVVTRDVWSLRVTTLFEVQQDALASLTASLVEANFLGRRKLAAFQFSLDLGSYSMGPLYIDPNVAGTRIEAAARASAVFSRETGSLEGSRSAFSVGYPLWALHRRWGASLSFRHDDSIERSFEGGDIRRYDAPETPQDDGLPWEYDRRELALTSEVVRQLRAGRLLQRVSLGHALDLSRPAVLDTFPGDAEQREAFERDVLPRSERASSIYARYRLFEPRYVMIRDLDTFDLREELRLGPDVQLTLSLAAPALGSETLFVRGRSQLGWNVPIGEDGVARATLLGETRLEAGELIDNELRGALVVATPRAWGAGRLVGRVDAAARIRERQNRFYTLGGETSLRGYPIGQFAGQRLVRANVEARTVGLPLRLLRAGAVAFWDAGHAADRFGELSLRHDVGVGIRWLTPQFSRFVIRVDWAVPLTGGERGLPGRITAGAGQVF
jgi:hypothetical protein